jgi:hypothetical protein
MTDSKVYSIALAQLSSYAGRGLVVRHDQAQALADELSAEQLDNVAYVRLLGLPADCATLIHWGPNLSIEIMLDNPAVEFPQLYQFAKLLDNHPVRVAMPVVAGFEKAVKLALALQFSVRLEIGQPTKELLKSLEQLLDSYLHQPTVSQPIELFHNLLLAFCHDEPLNLWAAQEEDPALIRYVDDDGRERFPGRLVGLEAVTDSASFVEDWARGLIDAQAECATCAFFDRCQGYFKWPNQDYDCVGIKALFRALQEAAIELRDDLAAAAANT